MLTKFECEGNCRSLAIVSLCLNSFRNGFSQWPPRSRRSVSTEPEWIFERKFDGIRLIAYKKGSRVELFSRNRLPQTIPALARAIAKLPHKELILDGEIDWHRAPGLSRIRHHVARRPGT